MGTTVDRAQWLGLWDKLKLVKSTIDLASVSTGAAASTTVTATGVALGDHVISFAAGVSLAGLTVTAYVSAADTITIRVDNLTGGSVDLASTTWTFLVGTPSGEFV